MSNSLLLAQLASNARMPPTLSHTVTLPIHTAAMATVQQHTKDTRINTDRKPSHSSRVRLTLCLTVAPRLRVVKLAEAPLVALIPLPLTQALALLVVLLSPSMDNAVVRA